MIDLLQVTREIAETLNTPTNPVEPRAAEPVVLEADLARIQQIIENLVGNAQRHSPEGKPVTTDVGVERRQRGACAVLTVADEGPGIAPEQRRQLFQRFSAGNKRGTLGLGLYLARGIAEAHGGTLTVASTPGKGACFRLELPMPVRNS